MDRSQYLAQALQQMQADSAAQPAAPAGLDLAAMQKIGQQREAWQAQNPGQSYMAHGFHQMGQNLMNAPQAVMAAPGNAMSGLQRLAQRFGAPAGAAPMTGQVPPY